MFTKQESMKQSLLFAFLLLIAGAVKAQVKDSLVLDETRMKELKSSIRITTFNDSIYRHLLDENTRAIKHVNYDPQKNVYSFYFSPAYRDTLLKWFANYDKAALKKRRK